MFLGSLKLRFGLSVDTCGPPTDVQVSTFGKFTSTHDLFAGMPAGSDSFYGCVGKHESWEDNISEEKQWENISTGRK
jgi:hypothetical protein